jgi:hypothetical protein
MKVQQITLYFLICFALGVACAQTTFAEAPEVSDIPDQTIVQGETFNKIKLNNYVSDDYDDDNKITWSYSGNIELSISIGRRNEASISIPDSTWSGSETITFTATDTDDELDSDAATFTVTSINEMPEITAQASSLSTDEELPLTLNLVDLVVTDKDNTYPTGFTLLIHNGTNYTHSNNTITPVDNFNGSLTVSVRVDDGEAVNSLSDPFDLNVTVNPVNDAPVVTNIPNQTIAEGASFTTFDLDSYVTDVDDPDATLFWTYSGANQMTVNIDDVTHVATISVLNANWFGTEIVTFRAADPAGLADSDAATFNVTAVNDAPQITSSAGTAVNTGVEYVYNATATDVDDDDRLEWSLVTLLPDMTLSPTTGSSVTVSWTPGPGLETSELVRLRVSDGKATTTQSFTITVTDLPAVNVISVDPVSTTTATINSEVVLLGIPKLRQYGICWNTTGDPDIENDSKTEEGPAPSDQSYTYATNLTDLTEGEIYYVRAYAISTEGTAYSDVFAFQTYYPPEITTGAITQPSTNSASGNGTITDIGNPNPTSHGVCWNTAENPTTGDSCTDEGPATAGVFSSPMTGLTSGTLYYVRAYATNAVGTVYGGQQSFTTADATSAPRATVAGALSPLTKATAGILKVGGIGVVGYKYRFDNGAWSGERSISQEIVLTAMGEGMHALQVIGKGGSGIWQAEQDPTVVTWTIDTTPPTATLWSHPTGLVGPFTAGIEVHGAGVAAYRFSLDEATWSEIYPVSKFIELPELSDGAHTLEIIGADLAGNWQDSEESTAVTWEVDASVPTAVLTNLPAGVTKETSINIGVTAAKGAIPIESYTYTLDNIFNWWYGEIPNLIDIGRLSEGEHSVCVNAYGNGTWQDGSEDGISSTESATCHKWHIDLTPPEIATLTVENAAPHSVDERFFTASKSAQLSWFWTSDDTGEELVRYRLWYSLTPITDETIEDAVEVFCDIVPGIEGMQETYIINGLVPGENYFFAVTAIDLAGNESALSNSPFLTTDNIVPEIHTLTFKQGGLETDNGAADELKISGAHFIETIGGNLVRFENNTTVFEVPSKQGAEDEISTVIPRGAPVGTYQVGIINKNGVSRYSFERVSISEAEKPLPAVRSITPLVIPTGISVSITITGDNFNESLMGINLLDTVGESYALTNIKRIDGGTIIAAIDLAAEFPEGNYYVQVVNAEGKLNEISAAKLEVYQPIILGAGSEAMATTGIIRLEGGMVPAFISLNSDDRSMSGASNKNHARIKVYLEPGTLFEYQEADDWVPYDGIILPPRVLAPDGFLSEETGPNIVSFGMGSDQRLRLGKGAKMFVVLEVTLPAYITTPVIYQVEPDGSLKPSGANGNWRGNDILVGGTILAERFNSPETGVNTFTIGVLMDHMSEYVIGSLSNEAEPQVNFSASTDNYGPCFIGAIVYK